jgi:hypothetical protein
MAAGNAPRTVPNDLCKWCPSIAYCPQFRSVALLVADGDVMAGVNINGALTPVKAGVAWERLKAARQLLSHVEKQIHAVLDEEGSIPLPSGKTLRKVIQPGNETLNGDTVFAFVAERYGQIVANAAVERTASKTKLRAALQARLPRGEVASAERDILTLVREAGGAERPMRQRIVEE